MSYDERFGRSGLFHDAVYKDSQDVVCVLRNDSYGVLKPFKVGETYELFHGWLTQPNNLPDMEVWWIEYKGQAHRCKVVEMRGVKYYQSIISGFVLRRFDYEYRSDEEKGFESFARSRELWCH